MADTTQAMRDLRESALALALDNEHQEFKPWEDYAGGVVSLAHCKNCNRYLMVKLHFGESYATGSALKFKCGAKS